MHAGDEALFIRNALQERRQLPLLLFGECGEQDLLVFASDATDGFKGRTPFLRYM
jgi:hypothetical protein